MTDHIYKKIELTGSSTVSMQEAIENAVSKAAKTLHDLRWFEVVETRGNIENGKIAHWQVTIKVGFSLTDPNTRPLKACLNYGRPSLTGWAGVLTFPPNGLTLKHRFCPSAARARRYSHLPNV
jgi:dodecin